MAVTPTTPPLTVLPDPPLTTDSEDVFNAKTDTTLLAQVQMVVQINTALAWQAASMAAALDYKNAASQSAQAASDSASAAAQSANAASQGGAQQVQLAAEQVGLANTARQAAEAAYASAQVVAAAAQAAIGLPALAGNAGKALVVKQDMTGVQFTMLGQAVGEVLIAASAPDATYLPANDAIYLKSAYPDLAAKLGAVRSRNLKSAFVPTTSAVSSGSLTRVLEGKDGVLVAIGNGVGMRSTDNGATWASIASLSANAGGVGLSTDGNGVWIAGGANNQVYRSTDNALTFTAIIVSSGLDNGTVHSITNNGAGTWVLAQSAGVIGYYRSTDNGLTWGQIANFGGSTALVSAAMTTAGVCAFLGSNRTLYLNSSSGAAGAWSSFALDPQSSFAKLRAGKSGKLYLMDSTRVLFSDDGGSTWEYVPQYFPGITDLYEDSNGSITVSTAARIYRSEDLVTWSSVPTGLTSDTASSALTTQAGHAVAVGNAAKTSRAPLAYNYDTTTQFRVPKLKTEAGASRFYKAKVAA